MKGSTASTTGERTPDTENTERETDKEKEQYKETRETEAA